MATYSYKIEQRDLDFSSRVSYHCFLDYILEAAGDDADSKGFGVRDLNLDNCSWVLTRLAVEFYRRPEQGEQLDVTTWVNDVSRLTTTRNMTVSHGDSPMAAAVTNWAVIDAVKRTPVDISSHIDFRGALTDTESPIAKPGRLQSFLPDELRSRRVSYSDVDFNNHTHAVRYVTWMLDMLPAQFFEGRQIVRIEVNFLNEALFDETVSIGMKAEQGETFFEIKNSDAQILTRGKMLWR